MKKFKTILLKICLLLVVIMSVLSLHTYIHAREKSLIASKKQAWGEWIYNLLPGKKKRQPMIVRPVMQHTCGHAALISSRKEKKDEKTRQDIKEELKRELAKNYKYTDQRGLESLINVIFAVNYSDLPEFSSEDFKEVYGCMISMCKDAHYRMVLGKLEDDYYVIFFVKKDHSVVPVAVKISIRKDDGRYELSTRSTDDELNEIFACCSDEEEDGGLYCQAEKIAYLVRGLIKLKDGEARLVGTGEVVQTYKRGNPTFATEVELERAVKVQEEKKLRESIEEDLQGAIDQENLDLLLKTIFDVGYEDFPKVDSGNFTEVRNCMMDKCEDIFYRYVLGESEDGVDIVFFLLKNDNKHDYLIPIEVRISANKEDDGYNLTASSTNDEINDFLLNCPGTKEERFYCLAKRLSYLFRGFLKNIDAYKFLHSWWYSMGPRPGLVTEEKMDMFKANNEALQREVSR